MLKNIIFVGLIWCTSLFLQSLVSSYYNNLSPDFLGASALSIMFINKSRFSILVILLFGLTSDGLIITYPGLISLSYLALCLVLLKYQVVFQIEGAIKGGLLVLISLFIIKIISFFILWVLSGINLTFRLADYEFWINLTLGGFYAYVLLELISYIKTKSNIKIFKQLLDS